MAIPQNVLNQTHPAVFNKLIKAGPSPEGVSRRFSDSCKDSYTAKVLVIMCIGTAINSGPMFLENWISHKRFIKDRKFMKALRYIKREWMLHKQWQVSKLELAGHCILEAGYVDENLSCIEKYRTRIGAYSIYSPDFPIDNLSMRSQAAMYNKTEKFSHEDIYNTGIKILEHKDALSEEKTKKPVCCIL